MTLSHFTLPRRDFLGLSIAMAVSTSTTWAAEAAAPAFKVVIVGRRRPGTTLAEHRHHIRHVHGELVLRYIAADPEHAPRRYVQNRVFDGQFRATAPGTDPLALNRDFVTQIWATDMAAAGRSRQRPFYLEHVKADEDNFVDQATVVFVPVHEREAYRRASAAAAGSTPCKLMGFVQRAPGADAQAFVRAWSALDLRAAPAWAKVQRHVKNEALPRPGPPGPAPFDAIDELWLDDEASARTLLTHWRTAVDAALVRPGLATEHGAFALLMHEDVVYAGARPAA